MNPGRIFLVAAVAFAVPTTPIDAAGQDCGQHCKSCGAFEYEGYSWHPFGNWNMDCTYTGTSGECDAGPCYWAAQDAVDAETIAAVVQAATDAEIAALVLAYGDRLLAAPARGAVFVTGQGCRSDAVVAMTVVSIAQAMRLQAAGARSLRAFLTEVERAALASAGRRTSENNG